MHPLSFRETVSAALKEDLGFGDVTTDSIFNSERGQANILAKTDGVVAGLPVVQEVFFQVDSEMEFEAFVRDGDRIKRGDILAQISGPLSSILKGERTALNFLQRLSGIATNTRKAVDLVQGTSRIVDTRKTTPGLRFLEKYAVRCGGGENHRFNLSDMVMIKDNHIKGAGSITVAVGRVREHTGFSKKIEVETTNLEEVQEALRCMVDVIMLDNMSLETMKEAVALIDGRTLVEASGGITQERLVDVAKTGVDLISLGYLTSSSPSLDISLNLIC